MSTTATIRNATYTGLAVKLARKFVTTVLWSPTLYRKNTSFFPCELVAIACRA
jgi:hypothetical protein